MDATILYKNTTDSILGAYCFWKKFKNKDIILTKDKNITNYDTNLYIIGKILNDVELAIFKNKFSNVMIINGDNLAIQSWKYLFKTGYPNIFNIINTDIIEEDIFLSSITDNFNNIDSIILDYDLKKNTIDNTINKIVSLYNKNGYNKVIELDDVYIVYYINIDRKLLDYVTIPDYIDILIGFTVDSFNNNVCFVLKSNTVDVGKIARDMNGNGDKRSSYIVNDKLELPCKHLSTLPLNCILDNKIAMISDWNDINDKYISMLTRKFKGQDLNIHIKL